MCSICNRADTGLGYWPSAEDAQPAGRVSAPWGLSPRWCLPERDGPPGAPPGRQPEQRDAAQHDQIGCTDRQEDREHSRLFLVQRGVAATRARTDCGVSGSQRRPTGLGVRLRRLRPTQRPRRSVKAPQAQNRMLVSNPPELSTVREN